MANQEHLIVNISANTRGLNAGLNKAQSKLASFGGKLKAVGSQLQTRLALPLIAGGGAAIKMAADFDKSMTKIKTLVGVAGAEVDAMASSVTKFANQAGVSSGEAADALFFITSAGLRGADAMAVLEASTKAAAIGLGETKTIADLATSAMNAYGVDTLGATDATDVLTAAVREGKLEANELAGAMGRTLPIASNMGIQFHEVGAAFAAMSRTGTNAAEASTQLNGIMMGIMKPTSDAEKAMKELGLSSQGLRQQIKDEGLLSVLETLRQASERNSGAFERVFGNVRALRGILDLTGKGAAVTAEIFQRMANTSGVTAAAFDELQKSSEFKLRKGLIQLKNSFTDLGGVLMESLMPMLQNVMGFLQDLFLAFNRLDPTTKQLVIGFTAFAAVLPTILTVLGSLGTVLAALYSPITLVAAAIGIVVLYFDDIANATVLFKNAIKFNVLRVLIRVEEFFKKYIFLPLQTAGLLFTEFKDNLLGGDFSGILDAAFEQGEQISKDAGKKLADSYVDEWEKNVEQRFDGTVSTLLKKIQGQVSSVFEGVGVTTPGGRKPVQALNVKTTGSNFGQITAAAVQITDLTNKMQNASDVTKQLANSVGDTLMNSFMALADGGNFFDSIIQGLKKLLVRLVAAAAAAAVLSALLPGAAANLGGVKGIFSSLSGLQTFANGGIISGPTLGLMGEYSGARSNPEVVSPLDKLKGMIGQTGQNVNVGGEFRIQGQDLVVALQRAERNRKRIL